MTEKEAYNHGYNATLKQEELLAQFPAQPHNYEEPPQFDAWRSGAQDAAHDNASDTEECSMEPDDFMTDGEADADALASAGYGTDEDYGF
jgi:hypothetical protein|tara:strand:+ start:735 stop:1004 length:270 start_codon:yes stop_codon:yes gene_type:complete